MRQKIELTQTQRRMMEVARVALMTHAPFFSSFYYDQIVEYPTREVDTAATDGRRFYFNPEYLEKLKTPEICFVVAHEVHHAVMRHPQRMKHYRQQGHLRGLPWDARLFNIAADFIINAGLVKSQIGMCNPSWLYDPAIDPDTLVEDLYEKMWNEQPPIQGDFPMPSQDEPCNGGAGGDGSQKTPPRSQPQPEPCEDDGDEGSRDGDQGQPPNTGYHPGTLPTYGESRRGGKPDPQAAASGGTFDGVLEPQVDPETGREDAPSEGEYKEAIAKAAASAKAMGKYPAHIQKMVDEILAPQISWREHLRLLLVGRIGSRRESWERPNRRRLALGRGDPVKTVVLPGRKGTGADNLAVVLDSSGSIYCDPKLLSMFFAELGGIAADCRPRKIWVIHCDAEVQRVDEVRSLLEVEDVRVKGTVGGGGTSFIPPFLWLKEQGIVPDTLVYLTDGYGAFGEAPSYPVIWAMNTDVEAPFGEVVRIKTSE